MTEDQAPANAPTDAKKKKTFFFEVPLESIPAEVFQTSRIEWMAVIDPYALATKNKVRIYLRAP